VTRKGLLRSLPHVISQPTDQSFSQRTTRFLRYSGVTETHRGMGTVRHADITASIAGAA